jgi:hypothetical protein
VRLVALGVFQLAFSAAAIAVLARSYESAAAIALLHIGLVAALWLSCVFVLGVLVQIRALHAAAILRPLFAFVPFALFASLFTVYAVDLVALRPGAARRARGAARAPLRQLVRARARRWWIRRAV